MRPPGRFPKSLRNLILTEHGALNDAYPKRYKRFIVSADDTHGAVQGAAPSSSFPFPQPNLFYTQEANGVLLSDWTTEFVVGGGDDGDTVKCCGLGATAIAPGVGTSLRRTLVYSRLPPATSGSFLHWDLRASGPCSLVGRKR